MMLPEQELRLKALDLALRQLPVKTQADMHMAGRLGGYGPPTTVYDTPADIIARASAYLAFLDPPKAPAPKPRKRSR